MGKRCISPDFNSKVVVASKVGNVMQRVVDSNQGQQALSKFDFQP